MNDALIGYSGYVGGTILRARDFACLYRSTDIETMRGRTFDTVVCCGAPAEKWRANRDPEADRAGLARLTGVLATVVARRLVLISTVDVYPVPRDVHEETPIDPTLGEPYGRHRLALERFCTDNFETTVVRLPGLYGRGLKKNAIFDLLHDRPVNALAGNATFQFYDTTRVWADVERVLAAGVRVANVTAAPVSMSTIAAEVFGRTLPTASVDGAPSYDVRSLHASLVGGAGGYWFSTDVVLEGLRSFVAEERG